MFYFTLIIGTLISISSYSWFSMWLGLEINLMSMIPLMSDPKNPNSVEASMKYFITQALGSSILLLSMIIMSMNFFTLDSNNFVLTSMYYSALFMKMSAAPFHFWFPEIMEGLTWTNSFIMLTWQKIAPLILITYPNFESFKYMMLVVIFSTMISGIMGINQTNMRKILAYSSINHLSWMLSSMLFFETIWMYYFLTYFIITFNIVIIMKIFNIFQLNQLFNFLNKHPFIKFFFMLNFASLGGLPPFLGFLPKWLTIQMLIKMHLFSLALVILIMTLLTLFFYMRIMYSNTTMNSDSKSKPINYMKKFNKIYLINFITLMILIMISIIYNIY
uniref:NADH-ubiquinone oxidoreductase chain 2 n=1 Tax=Oniticellus egregius TaxID=1165006 RepID=A0A1X9HEV4_9SCAR|nr:NADH deshydrogenase subunit 2 [Oniticellus egregius]